MALAAISLEQREARSALARALAAGLGGGAGVRVAGFPRHELEGSGSGGQVGFFCSGGGVVGGLWQSLDLAVCDAVFLYLVVRCGGWYLETYFFVRDSGIRGLRSP